MVRRITSGVQPLNRRQFGVLAAGMAVVSFGGVGFSAIANAQESAESNVKVPKYKPMNRGAPGGRIGGATRGTPPESLKILALAPDHVGYASAAQPVLYWYLSDSVPAAVFTLRAVEGADAGTTKDLSGPLNKGVQAVRLAELGLSLEPEKVYEWSIALPGDQPKDISALSRGLVAMRAPSSKVARQIEKAKPGEAADIQASNGYWYDAIDSVSRLITENPAAATYKEVRAGLAEQVKLYDVADFDRGAS